MSGAELRIVADVFREAADPMPDGDERARAEWVAGLFDTAADRIDAGSTPSPVPTMELSDPAPPDPASTPSDPPSA